MTQPCGNRAKAEDGRQVQGAFASQDKEAGDPWDAPERSRGLLGDDPDRLMTPRDVATCLTASIRTLERWRSQGEGPPWVRKGRAVAYRTGDVLEWVRQKTRGPAKAACPMTTDVTLREVTACPYAKDKHLPESKRRWQCDISLIDPGSGEPDRVKRVAPDEIVGPSDEARKAAIKWGEGERLREITARAQKAVRGEEEETPSKPAKKPKAGKTLAQLWEEFSERWITIQKAHTRGNYEGDWKNHLAPLLGDRPAAEIDLPDLFKLRDALEKKGLLQSSQRKVCEKLALALDWAMQRGIIPYARVPRIKWPRQKRRRMRHVDIYSQAQLEQQLAMAQSPGGRAWRQGQGGEQADYAMVLLTIDGALRIGEVAALQWADVDFEQGTMLIRRTVAKGKLQDTAKGEDGIVPLSPRLLQALAELKAVGDPVFVIGDGSGGHFTMSCLGQRAVRIQELAGLPEHGPHRNRHSILSLLAEQGVDPYALQALARHTDLKTTMEYYIHVNQLKLAQQAIAQLAGLTQRDHLRRARAGILAVLPGRRGNAVETKARPRKIRAAA